MRLSTQISGVFPLAALVELATAPWKRVWLLGQDSNLQHPD
jgi:hypothetical protein